MADFSARDMRSSNGSSTKVTTINAAWRRKCRCQLTSATRHASIGTYDSASNPAAQYTRLTSRRRMPAICVDKSYPPPSCEKSTDLMKAPCAFGLGTTGCQANLGHHNRDRARH